MAAAAVAASSPIHFLRAPVRRGLIPALGVPKQHVLWIGCSSSGTKYETHPLGFDPEEVLVHRNIGNIAGPSDDLSLAGSLDYALKMAKVNHIVVCGHYGCKFVACSNPAHSLERWLSNVAASYESWRPQLERIASPADRDRAFAELHTWKQAHDLMEVKDVRDAIDQRDLKVLTFMYDPEKNETVQLVKKEGEDEA